MLWRYEWRNGLRLVGGSTEQRDSAFSAIEQLERANHSYAETTGGKLKDGLQNGLLGESVVFSLSAWCNTAGQYQCGVGPAQRISMELFNGQILPRLRSASIREHQARNMLQDFLKSAGVLAEQTRGVEAVAEEHLEEEDSFVVQGRGGQVIRTLDEWFQYAPPAGGASQWCEGRSAMELARRWVPGRIPPEVQRLLDGTGAFAGFVPERGDAECKTPLDGYGGNTRNHDLVVTGWIPGARANLDIEGKADETFGETIAARLAAAEAYLRENPRSKALARVRELCAAVFNQEPGAVGGLRYQLLHAVAAALIRARGDGADQVAFIVHEFQSAETRASRVAANGADFAAFVGALGGDAAPLAAGGRLVGPLFVPGNARVPAEVALYIGKAVCVL